MTLPSITILKPGTFTDVNGTKVTFTTIDLAEVVDSYDPASYPAPLVIGHPESNGPAHGWVGSLLVEGGRLLAEPIRVGAAFAEAIRDGRYRKVSPSLFPPSSPGNPRPGRWALRHIGFLGASSPAIKGLGVVAFANGRATFTPEADLELIGSGGEASRFRVPIGYTVPRDSIALAERATAVHAEFPRLSFMEAFRLARDELAAETVALAEGSASAAAHGHALAARIRRLQAADHTLSYWSAFERARAEAAI